MRIYPPYLIRNLEVFGFEVNRVFPCKFDDLDILPYICIQF